MSLSESHTVNLTRFGVFLIYQPVIPARELRRRKLPSDP